MQKHLQRLLLIVTMMVVPWVTQAQTLGDYTYSTGVDTTKWIDMSSATQILTPSGNDGLASSLQNIGFTFPFGEDGYTQYSVNTDGNMRLGYVTGTANYSTPFSSSNANINNPKINFFGCDGYGVSGSHYVKALNTVDANNDSMLVVEFCTGTYNSTTRNELYKWQVHLYPNGNIEVVYGPAPTAGPNVAHQQGLCINASDGWTIDASHVATHFTSGTSTTIATGTWPAEGRYYSFVRPIVTCPRPTAIVVSNLDSSSFDISWTDTSDANAWIVRVMAGSTSVYNNVEYTNSVSLSSLTPYTTYSVQVAGLCLNGDTSSFRTIEVRTPCAGLTTLPFTENFEGVTGATSTSVSVNNLPPCWSNYNTGTSTSYSGYPMVYNSSSYAHSGSQAMRFYTYTTAGTYSDQIAIMPPTDSTLLPLSNMQVSFWIRSTSTSYSSYVIVGVMTNPSDASTFVPIETVSTNSSTTYTQHTVMLGAYNGPHGCVAFKAPQPTSSYNALLIDDIVLDEAPSCLPVHDLTVTDVTGESISVAWSPIGTETQWNVTVGTNSYTVYDTVYTLTGLTPNTEYTIAVQADCGSGDTSSSVTITARTSCSDLTTLPFTENFDSVTGATSTTISVNNLPPCWNYLNHGTRSNYMGYPAVYSSTTYSHSGSNSMRFYSFYTAADSAQYAILPMTDSTLYPVNDLMLTFQMRAYNTGSTYGAVAVIGVMTNPTDASTFVPVDTVNSNGVTTYSGYEVSFAGYTGPHGFVTMLFPYAANVGYNYNSGYVDDIVLDVVPTCPPIQNLAQTEATTSSVTLNWTEMGTATQWVLEYDTVDFVPGTGAGNIEYVTALPYTLSGLDSGYSYYIYVHADCGAGDTSTNVFVLATTMAGGGGLPYTCGFEGAGNNGWDFINGSQANKWHVGTAANNGGSKGLYISNDNGTSNSYDGTSESYVFAVKEFTLEDAGEYAYSYDWKCNGESSFDFMRAALVPGSTVLTAGSYCGFDNTSAMPSGGIALDGGYRLNLQTSWQTQSGTFLITTPGTYKWVFMWRNDGSVTNQPPIAIDNVMLMQNTCPAPTVYVDHFGIDSVILAWHPNGEETSWEVISDSIQDIVYDTTYAFGDLHSNTAYHFAVRAICSAGDTSMPAAITQRTACSFMDTLPFFYDFEDALTGTSTTGSTFVDCWTHLNNGTSYGGYPYVGNSTTYNHTPGGTKGLYWYNTTTTGTYGDYEVVVLPPVDTNIYPARNLQLRFWAKASSSSPVFQVGVMTNPDDVNTFVQVATVNASNTNWQEYEVPLGLYTGDGAYVALKSVRASWTAYVDDFTLELAPTCPRITDLRAATTAAAAHVSWEYSAALGIAPESYEVAYRYTADTFGTPITSTVYGLSEVLTGLDPDTSYTLTVTPDCGIDGYGQSKTIVFSTHALPCLEWDTSGAGGSASSAAVYSIGTPGTSTTNVMPTNGGYSYAYCNHLIRTSDINLPAGTTYISGIDFQFAGTSAMTNKTNCTLYMCHTNMTTCDNFANPSDLVLVYEGPLNCTPTTDGWNHFEFNRGTFAYNGTSNMMVAIVDNSGATDGNATFYYEAPGVAVSHRVYRNDAPYTFADLGTQTAANSVWRTNMRLTTGGNGGGNCITTASCAEPAVIIDSVRETEAYLSWIPGYQETSWDVEYRPLSDTVWTPVIMGVSTPNATISGLTANTPYEVRVSPNCTDTLLYAKLQFRTECGGTPVPFVEHFDTWSTTIADPLPDCWYKKTNYSSQYPSASTSYNHTPGGSKAMYMYSTSSTWSYMVLPLFAPPIDSLQLSFWLYKTNTSYTHRLIVGVMTDPADETTFQPVDTVACSALSTWEEFTIMFNHYTDSGRYIAIMSPDGEYSYPYLDDLVVDYIPDCLPVESLAASNITGTSADITWVDSTGTSSWTVEYGLNGFTVGTGTIVYAYDTTLSLTGLSPNTAYDVYVTPDCSSGIAGSAYLTFRTECGMIDSLPFFENFESYPDGASSYAPPDCGIPCWKRLDNASTYHFGYIGSRSSWPSGGHSGTGFLYYYMPTTTGTYADWIITVLPPINTTLHPLNTLQMSFWVKMNSATTSGDIVIGAMTDPTQASTFVPLDTVSVAGNEYAMKEAYLSGYTDTGAYIALRYTRNPSTTTYYFVDDIMVEPIPACPPVTGIVLAGLDSNMLSVTWTENGTATSWNLEYGVSGFTPGTGSSAVVTSLPYTITGLTPATNYDIYVTPICSEGTSLSRSATFRTANSYVGLPFICNFENTAQNALFALENGTNTNKWAIGAATNNGGTHAMYISNDNGTSNSYTISSSTLDYAYVDLMIPTPGDYGYSFDWKCYGESTLDYLRVALIPISESLTAGTALPTGLNATSMPASWISLDGNGKLNLTSSWQTRSDVISIPSAGVYHLAFVFRCDGSVGTMPPPAVDNITLVYAPCTRPDSITISNLTQTSADFVWSEMGTSTEWQYQLDNGTITTVYTTSASFTGLTANTPYTFKVRSICGGGDTSFWRVYNFRTPCGYITLPYTQDFESEATGSSTTGSAFVNCWTLLNNGTSYGGYPYVSSSSTYNHTPSGTKGLYWYNTTTTGTYGDYQVVVLPPFDTTISASSLQLSFWAKASSASYVPVFKIGVMTDPNNVSTFVGVDTITITTGTAWTLIEVPLSAYTGSGQYVAVKADRPSSSWYAYVDDFTLDYTPTCVAPRNIYATDASTSSLTVDWVDINPAIEWQVEYGPQGFTRGSSAGTSLTVYSHPIIVTGLDTLTNYDFYIRPVCTVGDTARWYYPTTLNTAMCDNSNVFSVGSASSASTTYYAPVNNYYRYTLSEVILDSAEIGGAMDVEFIGYYYDYATASTDKTNCTIYFQPTTRTTFSSSSDVVALDTATAVKVYTGHLNCSQGWNFFALDTVYHYDGTTNLMVIVDDNSNDYNGSAYVFKSEPCTGNKTLYYYSDSYDPDVMSITSSYSGTKAVASWRPVMQLVSCVGVSCRQPVITGVTKTYESATITWNGTGTEYEVNIKESAAPNWPATDIHVTGNSYTFTGLQPATNYTFRVRQDCNADSLGYSDWTVDGFLTDSLPCLAPDSLTVTGVTNSTATLDWNPRGYETVWQIHVWTTGGVDSVYTVTSHPATVGGFTANTTYNASVRPLCGSLGNIEGDWGDTIIFNTAVCPDVTGLGTRNVTANSVDVYWNPDPMAQQWIIEYGFHGFDLGSGTQVTTSLTTYTINGLLDDMEYDFRVRAVCGDNWQSEGWATTSATTLEGGVPCDAPTAVNAVVAGNAATVSWTANTGNLSFVLEYGTRGFALGSGTTVTANASPVTLSNLAYETAYDVYVKANCADNTSSAWSAVASFTTEAQGSEDCDPVTDLAATNVTESAALLTWTPGNSGDEWEVVLTTAAGATVSENSTTERQFQLTGLTPGTAYVAKVRTVCGDGQYSDFASVSFTTNSVGIADVTAPACTIYPNPTSGATTVSVSGISGKVRIAIVDMNGREVTSETLDCSGDCAKTMSVDNLAQGAYFVRITGENANMVRKLIVR